MVYTSGNYQFGLSHQNENNEKGKEETLFVCASHVDLDVDVLFSDGFYSFEERRSLFYLPSPRHIDSEHSSSNMTFWGDPFTPAIPGRATTPSQMAG
jgi:hypothetical protein